MKAEKILNNFSQIFCPIDQGAPLRGKQMSEAIIINGGYIAIKDGKILHVGQTMIWLINIRKLLITQGN